MFENKFEISQSSVEAKDFRELWNNPRVGGVVTFEGRVRNHNENKAVKSLEYEAYPILALKEGNKIIQEAVAKFGVTHAYCVHRTGHLAIGEMAVWVVVCAEHRGEAFKACEYIIDEVKNRVPVWKKEHYVEGEPVWVRCDRCEAHHHEEHHHHHSHHSEAHMGMES